MYNGKAFNVNIHNLKIKGKKVKREIIDQVDAAVFGFSPFSILPPGISSRLPCGK